MEERKEYFNINNNNNNCKEPYFVLIVDLNLQIRTNIVEYVGKKEYEFV